MVNYAASYIHLMYIHQYYTLIYLLAVYSKSIHKKIPLHIAVGLTLILYQQPLWHFYSIQYFVQYLFACYILSFCLIRNTDTVAHYIMANCTHIFRYYIAATLDDWSVG